MITLIPVNKNNLKKVMDRYAPIVKGALDNKMREQGKYVTGKTSRSVKVKPFELKNRIGLRATSSKLFNILHTGRRPGKAPPLKAIEDWIKNKPQINPRKSIRSTAYAIANKIGRDGFPGKDIWGMALESVLRRLLSDTSEAYIKDIEEHLKKSSEYARD